MKIFLPLYLKVKSFKVRCLLSSAQKISPPVSRLVPMLQRGNSSGNAPASLAAFPRRSVGLFITSYLKLMRMGHKKHVPDRPALSW